MKNYRNTLKKYFGFSLMELMIVIAIIGILAGIAIPSYQSYTKRAYYTEIVQAAQPYRTGIEECYQMLGDLSDCKAGTNGVPAEIKKAKGNRGMVDSISVSSKSKITVKPRKKHGIEAKSTYILTPKVTNNRIEWITSGEALKKGYVKGYAK